MKNNQKGFLHQNLIIFLVILVVILGLAVAYKVHHKANVSPTATSSSLSEYKNEQYGFKFTYPRAWGDASTKKTALQKGYRYAISFSGASKNLKQTLPSIVLESNDSENQFCDGKGNCMKLPGFTKTSFNNSLMKDKSTFLKYDSTSTTILTNSLSGNTSSSQLLIAQIVDLPKINVSAARGLLSHTTSPSSGCGDNKLAESNSGSVCVTKNDFDGLSKTLKSIQKI